MLQCLGSVNIAQECTRTGVKDLLQLQNVKKQFQNNPILNGINLTIEDGEIVSILGPSGSGKTTLLNIILGLTQIDEGSILFAGQDISQTSMKDRGFNIVFQDYALFPNLNAYQNIIYGLKNRPNISNKQEVHGICSNICKIQNTSSLSNI